MNGPDARATAALTESIRRAALLAAAVMQAVMAVITVGALGSHGFPLIAAQVMLGIIALAAQRAPIPVAIIPLGMWAIGLWSLAVGGGVNSVLVFAACWEIDFATCVAALIILRRYVVPLAILTNLALTAALVVLAPDLGTRIAVSVIITQITIVLALRIGLPRLLRPALEADAAAAEAEAAQRRAVVIHRSTVRAAEDTRVLHDTAINTLGAIANGGAGTADARAVREQCVRDVALLGMLRSERSAEQDASLEQIFEQPRAQVVRSGIGDAELARFGTALPAALRSAIVGCVREAVTNALKHSGADRVEIGATESAIGLRITVSDAGRGFSGPVPQDRGIAGSILARAREHGFEADVESRPGLGTTVSLSIPRVGSSRPVSPDAIDSADAGPNPGGIGKSVSDERDELLDLQRRAGGYWALGVTAVGAILLIGGGANEHFALYPMLAIMLLSWAVTRVPLRRRGDAAIRSAFLIVCTCAVFFLSAAATEFGTVTAHHWQALAATGPFVLLFATAEGRLVRRLGVAAWVALAAGMAAWMAPISGEAARIVLVAACVGLGFSAMWRAFQIRSHRLGEVAARSRRAAFAARLQADLDDAARDNYRRWVDAGLESAVRLLHEIADGEREPSDVLTRDACGDEERYLRQLVQMSPELVHLSRALIPALRFAREAEVELALRLGGVDVASAAAAGEIAATVMRGIAATAPGGRLSASLFPTEESLRLTLVGSGVAPPSDDGAVRFEDLGRVGLLEASFPRAAAEPRESDYRDDMRGGGL